MVWVWATDSSVRLIVHVRSSCSGQIGDGASSRLSQWGGEQETRCPRWSCFICLTRGTVDWLELPTLQCCSCHCSGFQFCDFHFMLTVYPHISTSCLCLLSCPFTLSTCAPLVKHSCVFKPRSLIVCVYCVSSVLSSCRDSPAFCCVCHVLVLFFVCSFSCLYLIIPVWLPAFLPAFCLGFLDISYY